MDIYGLFGRENKLRIGLLIPAVLLLVLAGCGGGGGGGGEQAPTVRTGVLVDSPVSGIHYESLPSGKSGTTGPGGEYEFVAGDTVTFSIGGMEFPTVTAGAIITPLTLAGATSVTDPQATNISIMLQSLDDDPTDDIITINAAAAANATAVNFNQPIATFISEPAVTNLMMNTGSTLVDATEAQAHVTETIVTMGGAGTTVTDTSIVGAWDFGFSETNPGMVVFYDNGFYIIWDGTAGCTTGGVEYGTYSYDGTTLISSQIVDENSDCGLSGTPSVDVAISGNDLDYDSGSILFSRVDGGADSLVGAWDIGGSTSSPAGLVFYDNGFYIQWQTSTDPNCTPAGVEYGTYTFDPTLTVGLTSVNITVDENGECGLSHPMGVTEFSVAGNVLTIVDAIETITINRLGGLVVGGGTGGGGGGGPAGGVTLADLEDTWASPCADEDGDGIYTIGSYIFRANGTFDVTDVDYTDAACATSGTISQTLAGTFTLGSNFTLDDSSIGTAIDFHFTMRNGGGIDMMSYLMVQIDTSMTLINADVLNFGASYSTEAERDADTSALSPMFVRQGGGSGGGGGVGVSLADLIGTWEIACADDGGGGSFSATLNIGATSTYNTAYSLYSDAACTNPIVSETYSGTFILGINVVLDDASIATFVDTHETMQNGVASDVYHYDRAQIDSSGAVDILKLGNEYDNSIGRDADTTPLGDPFSYVRQ